MSSCGVHANACLLHCAATPLMASAGDQGGVQAEGSDLPLSQDQLNSTVATSADEGMQVQQHFMSNVLGTQVMS